MIARLSFSQIKVFERTVNDALNNETIFKSDKRIFINLNGEWKVSFENSNNFSKIIVPFATDSKSSIYLNREFNIPDSLLSKYNFIFYSEGINYESEVKVNNVIVSRNNGGCKFIYNEIPENVLNSKNSITININCELNNSRTFPLSAQVNYARNYNGILSNIYICAVPKIYISETLFSYSFSADNSISLVNNLNINTLNIDSLISEGNNFFIRTELIRKSDSAKIFESSLSKLEASSYQSYKLINNASLKNIEFWSSENPRLYLIKTSIIHKDEVVDDVIYETGFKKVSIKGPELYINDSKIKLRGINYYEDLPLFAGAMEYNSVEKDLKSIKELGFNCIRVPGKSAHPFVIKIAQRIGLYILQEYPFNEVPSELLSNDKYVKNALEYFENILKRDFCSPAVLFWGIGNDFDVTTPASESYVTKIKEMIRNLDSRPIYYTTKNFENDKVKDIIQIKGYNLNDINYNSVKVSIDNISRSDYSFISSVGVASDNSNRNGFGDIRSAEYQAKFLTETINSSEKLPGIFIKSFADFNTESPLLLHYDNNNPFMQTEGIFDFNRNAKYSYNIIKRLLNNQGFQKIPEGNVSFTYATSSNYYIIFGLATLILLMLAMSKTRNFKDNLWKSIITSKNFLYLIKEQNAVPNFHNILLLLFLSSIISLLFGSIIFNLRMSPNFDLLLSKFIDSDSLKIIIIFIINSPVFLFITLSIIIIALFFLSYIMMIILLRIIKKKVKLKSSFSVFIWSFVLFIIFLPFGIIFSKTINSGSSEIIQYTLYLYICILIYSLIKLINGSRYVFELSVSKSYLYGILMIFFIYMVNYYYFISYKSINIFFNLIKSYN